MPGSEDIEGDIGDLEPLRDPELWLGSDYELALAMPLGSLDGEIQLRLLDALSGAPRLHGYVSSKQDLGKSWVTPNEATAEAGIHYGVLRIPGKRPIGCRTVFLANDFEAWCLLAIPMAMLELVYPVRYPVEPTSPWIAQLDALLASIASHVYQSVPFSFGSLGEEASALVVTAESISEAVLTRPGSIAPVELFNRFHVTPHGILLSDGLWWTGSWTSS